MRTLGACLVAIIAFANPLCAQQPETLRTAWPMWHVSAAYPEAAAAGVSVVFGQQWSTGFRGRRSIEGIQGGADVGFGGASVRVGWADLAAYDAGIEGWSYEAVYVRPWLLRWGLDRGTDYLGAGVTRYPGYTRVSGAVLVNTRSSRLAPGFTFGIVLPIR